MNPNYVLITAARNEEAHIGETIRAVIDQTVKPGRWVIVSDASMDRTDAIVSDYARRYKWIIHIRREQEPGVVGFVSKVLALRAGMNELQTVEYELIGNLDADITVAPGYYEALCRRFAESASLGIAGGFVYDLDNGTYQKHSPDDPNYVSGAVQMFRRACYEDIGGYLPIEEGGEDTVAAIMAQMKGWEVRMIPDLHAIHHKSKVLKRGMLAEFFREGALFYVIGSHPLFEAAKTIGKVAEKPYLLGALARLGGLLWTWRHKGKRAVPDEVMMYLRSKQMKRIRRLFRFGA